MTPERRKHCAKAFPRIMALETPQSHSLKPSPCQNPQEFSSEYIKECNSQRLRAANMEKFREVVIKLANRVPNKPLSETQNSIIQDRFHGFLSVLHTPDHPPYAWMIERALGELNEVGGSSEKSISDFIREEYDDLPWSHFTLLKHHLQALCECGNIMVTKGQRYLLSGAVATLNLGKRRRRKQTRRKQYSDWEIKQHKRHKKYIAKEKHLSCTIQEIKEELLQSRQLKCEGQKHLDDNTKASSHLQQQLQEHMVSNTNELQEVKTWAANRSEHQGFLIPAVKPSCEEQHHPQKINAVADSSPRASSLWQLQPQGHVVLDTSKLQEEKSGTTNRTEHQVLAIREAKPSCAEHHQSEAIPGVAEGPTVSSRLSICFKQSNGFQAHEFSELEASDVKESLPASRTQQQRKPWCKQLLSLKRSQPECQASVESSRVTRKKANLCIQVKKNAGQPKVVSALSVDLKQADPQEFGKFACLHMHPDIEPKHPLEKRVSQEKPSCRVLRFQLLNPEQSNALITADLSPSHNQHHVQQQFKCHGRPPKAKPESGITKDKFVAFPDPHPRQQSRKAECKRRGRPPKCKSGHGRPGKEQEGD